MKGTLYVSRPLLNAEQFIAWAKEQGFATTLQPGDLHVTIAYSKTALDWPEAETGSVSVGATGDRSVTPLGDGGAVVLRFESSDLKARWKALRDAGAAWDHDGYRPHVTISWDAADVDLSKVTPFDGELQFGPEKFAEIKEDWKDTVTEKSAVRIAKIDEDLGLVFGWAIVCKIDGEDYYDLNIDAEGTFKGQRVPEHITEDAMLKATVDFMSGARPGNEMHAGPDKGTFVCAWPMTTDIAKAMGITTAKTGLMVAYKPPADVLAKFKSGEYTGFSIEGARLNAEETA